MEPYVENTQKNREGKRFSVGDRLNPRSCRSLMLISEGVPMIEVSIPSMEREVDDSGKSKKARTSYLFSVLFHEPDLRCAR